MAKLLPMFTLTNYRKPRTILVIGCGGTGAFVISHLSRLIGTIDHEVQFYISDGDTVEEKNLVRQHFIAQDVGRNKAEVLAERYAAAFGVQIKAITHNVENLSDFPTDNSDALIIGCVDNNASRQLIHEKYFSNSVYYSKFWIDSGNEESSGQVICGLSLPYYSYYGSPLNTQKTPINRNSGVFSLPCVTEVYPELLKEESKFNSELSCAERAFSAPQNMMTNVTAATLTMNYAQRILLGLPLTSHGVEFSNKNVFTTRFNTKKNLSMVNHKRRMEIEK